MKKPNRVLIIVNNPAFFLSHRLPIALAAKAQGYEVHVATMAGPAVKEIQAQGLQHHVIPLTRSGKNPLQELYSIVALWRLIRRLQPTVIHAVTIKPVLYGGLAARLARRGRFLAAISGLGYIFTQNTGWLRRVVLWLYRWALGGAGTRVIFQNAHDKALMLKAGVVKPEQCVLIPGSGVAVEQFALRPEPELPLTLFMAARLLKDKGVREFVEAARQSHAAGHDWRWRIAGSPDPGNPASISVEDIQAWQAEGVIEWLGEREDIPQLYGQAHIAVLPSYREGLPKSLIEAAAAGRPVVTTDVPGCRDAIIEGQTGLLVPARDARALFAAVAALAEDTGRRHQMGRAARRLAEQRFSLQQVVNAHLALYKELSAS